MIDSSADRGGTLKPMPELKPGRTYLSFDIEKWGLKDAETYVDPRITISVHGTQKQASDCLPNPLNVHVQAQILMAKR